MNPLSLRRARSHVAKPATIAAVAALAISAMAGTAVPASAQSDASTPDVITPGAVVNNTGFTEENNVSISGLTDTSHLAATGLGVTETGVATASDTLPELSYSQVPLNMTAVESISLVLQFNNPTASDLDLYRMVFLPVDGQEVDYILAAPVDGTAVDNQGIRASVITGAPANLEFSYGSWANPDAGSWEDYTALGYGAEDLAYLEVNGTLAAGSTLTITLPLDISALADAPQDNSKFIDAVTSDQGLLYPNFGLRAMILAVNAWDVALAAPPAPTQSGDTVTIPEQAGVTYLADGVPATGPIVLADGQSVTVTAIAADGFTFAQEPLTWNFSYTAPVVETPDPSTPVAEETHAAAAEEATGVSVETGGSDSNGLIGLGAALALIGAGAAAGIHRKH
jgi:hypothetical protein